MPQFQHSLRYEHPDLGDNPRPDPNARANMAICKWVGDLLDRTYPGHAWYVKAAIGQHGRDGSIQIQIRALMPTDAWYHVKLSDTLTDPGGKRTVLKGAGELLERYGLRRGQFDLVDWRVAMSAMPLHKIGRGHLAPLID